WVAIGSPRTTATTSSSCLFSPSLQAQRPMQRTSAPKRARARPPNDLPPRWSLGLRRRRGRVRRDGAADGGDDAVLRTALQLGDDLLVDHGLGLLPQILDEGLEGLGPLLALDAVHDRVPHRLEGALDALLATEELDHVEALLGRDEVRELARIPEGEGGAGELLAPVPRELLLGLEGEVAAGPLRARVVGAL